MLGLFLFFFVVCCVEPLPVVDKGVFVITGVKTCRSGLGYCVLGSDCTVDSEFTPDELNGHCDGLKKAFTPRAYFVCCSFVEPSTTTTEKATTLSNFTLDSIESESNSGSSESTTIIYEEQTEISVVESVSLQLACSSPSRDRELQPRLGGVLNQQSVSCWTAAFQSRTPPTNDPGSFTCTGAIVTPNIVLTSGTCAARLTLQHVALLNAKAIIHPSRYLAEPLSNTRAIRKIVIHEGYGVRNGSRLNDVGLVLIEDGVNNDGFCSICVDKGEGDCIVSGYSHPSDGTPSDGLLHEAEQTLINCQDYICAAGKESSEACFSPRDAGSPLACSTPNGYRLTGLFSSGFHCGSRLAPVQYTDLDKYRIWIGLNSRLLSGL